MSIAVKDEIGEPVTVGDACFSGLSELGTDARVVRVIDEVVKGDTPRLGIWCPCGACLGLWTASSNLSCNATRSNTERVSSLPLGMCGRSVLLLMRAGFAVCMRTRAAARGGAISRYSLISETLVEGEKSVLVKEVLVRTRTRLHSFEAGDGATSRTLPGWNSRWTMTEKTLCANKKADTIRSRIKILLTVSVNFASLTSLSRVVPLMICMTRQPISPISSFFRGCASSQLPPSKEGALGLMPRA